MYPFQKKKKKTLEIYKKETSFSDQKGVLQKILLKFKQDDTGKSNLNMKYWVLYEWI